MSEIKTDALDALIHMANGTVLGHENTLTLGMIDAAAYELTALRARVAQGEAERWIPVIEGLPTESGGRRYDVTRFDDGNGHPFTERAYWYEGHWWQDHPGVQIAATGWAPVVAWRPLQAPYVPYSAATPEASHA